MFIRTSPITPDNMFAWFKAFFSLRHFNAACLKILRDA